MNIKTSFFNTKIFTQNIRRLLPLLSLWIVIETFFSIISIRGIINISYYETNQMRDILNNSYIQAQYTRGFLGVGNQLMMVFYSFCVSASIFHYMFQPKLNKTIHALPVTRLTMFVSNILSGIALIIIPYIITHLIGGIYIAVSGFSFTCVLPSIGLQIAYCFIFISIAVLAVMLTGHTIAAPFMFGFLNFGFFVAENLCMLIVNSFFFGLDGSLYQSGHTIFTPIVYLSRWLTLNLETMKFYKEGLFALAAYCAAGIVLLILSYILYSKRMIENQGDPIAAKKLEPIFHYSLTLIGGTMLTILIWGIIHINTVYLYLTPISSAQMIIIFFISSIIVFYIIKMLFNKTLKIFSTKNPGLLIYIGVSALVFGLSLFDVFGIEKKVPDIDNVKSATVSYDHSLQFELDDSKQIEQFINIHKEIINSKSDIIKNGDFNENENSCTIEISYNLKNGKTLRRSYTYCYTIDDLNDKNNKITSLDRKIYQTIIDNNIIHNALTDMKNIYDISVMEIESIAPKNGITYNDTNFFISDADMYNLKNAILTDSANGTLLFNSYKHVPNSELDGLYSVDIYDENSWLELVVTPEAKDTIKVIEKLKTDLNAENADFSDEQ